MLALHGFALSNYYNKVKLALLEKGLAFEEVYIGTGSTDEAVLACSPLAKFAPYVAGDTFTMADCCAYNSLPLVGMASKAAFGEDLLAAGGVDYRPYIKFVGERPAAQKVAADRKAAQTKT